MKINSKIISTIFVIIFIIIFSYYNFDEYKTFHQNKINIEKNKLEHSEKIERFEVKNIKELNDIDFYYTPNKEFLTQIVELIENAKEEIFLEIYMLTEKRISEALIKMHKKGINVQVILEKSPYKAFNINNKSFESLSKAWINIVWSNKNNYSLNHSKVLLIDDISIISTGNFTYSTFTKNRDFFIITSDKNINTKLKENFYYDYKWEKINIYDNNLIFSPNDSRIQFEKLFNEANNNIKMYFQYLLDDILVEKLIKLKNDKNIEITIILPETAKEDINTKKIEKNWIKTAFMKKITMHAKAILIDDKYLFIWSINFSQYSIDKNREVWILIKNSEIITDFLKIFSKDFKEYF